MLSALLSLDLSLRNADRDMLRLQERIQPFAAQFASPPALLHSAKRALARAGRSIVNGDGPRLDLLRKAEHSSQIARHRVGAESILRTIGQFNRLGLRFE